MLVRISVIILRKSILEMKNGQLISFHVYFLKMQNGLFYKDTFNDLNKATSHEFLSFFNILMVLDMKCML
jgi:hypothetical protein